jgi:alcohol dehydrogenase
LAPSSISNRSLLLVSPKRLEWISSELPRPGPDETLIRTCLGAISIGTEIALYRGQPARAAQPSYPRMTGYESMGVIISAGDQVTGVEPGARVVSSYGHCHYALAPPDRVVPIADDITDELAILLILSGDAATGVYKTGVRPGERVLITGAGEMGLLTLFNLRARGIEDVDVVEPIGARAALALSFGARRSVSYSELNELEPSYHVGFECSDSNDAFQLLQRKMGSRGRICIIADGNNGPFTLSDDFHNEQLIVYGSSNENNYRDHADWFFDQLRAGWATRLRRIFDYEISCEDLVKTFERIDRGVIKPVKVSVFYANTQQAQREVVTRVY